MNHQREFISRIRTWTPVLIVMNRSDCQPTGARPKLRAALGNWATRCGGAADAQAIPPPTHRPYRRRRTGHTAADAQAIPPPTHRPYRRRRTGHTAADAQAIPPPTHRPYRRRRAGHTAADAQAIPPPTHRPYRRRRAGHTAADAQAIPWPTHRPYRGRRTGHTAADAQAIPRPTRRPYPTRSRPKLRAALGNWATDAAERPTHRPFRPTPSSPPAQAIPSHAH
jgi:hypothetical protein